MTKDDKILLVHFVTRTGMYIHPVDIHNIQSFLHGYEAGRKNKCHFYESAKDLLSKKYKLKYLSDGLLGQLKRLAKKQSVSEVVAFRRIALEVILSGSRQMEVEKVLKARIVDLIGTLEKASHPWYNDTWKEHWHSFVSLNNKWFKELWDKKELVIIKSMDEQVRAGSIFNSNKERNPSDALLALRDKFSQLNCT